MTSRWIDGRDRQVCTACERILYENPVPATAAVVFENDGAVLLVKRNVEPKKGQWCLPGGFIEVDETPEAGCLRELKEETNLSGRIDRLLGVYVSDSVIYKAVLIVGYLVRDAEGRVEAGDDSDEARFFTLAEMPPLAFASHRKVLEQALKIEGA